MGLRLPPLCVVAATAAMLAFAAPASADELTEEPEVAPGVKLSYRIKTQLTELSGELDKHLSALSFDLIGLRFDAHENRAQVKVDTGDGEHSLRLDGNIHFRRGVARIQTRVDLGLAGRRFSFDLPEFEMVPRSFQGQRYVELRLPLIEGTF